MEDICQETNLIFEVRTDLVTRISLLRYVQLTFPPGFKMKIPTFPVSTKSKNAFSSIPTLLLANLANLLRVS